MCTKKDRKAFPARYVRSDRRELLAHKSRVMADDQGSSRLFILPFQIAADRVSYTSNILESKIVCNYRSPSRGAKSNFHLGGVLSILMSASTRPSNLTSEFNAFNS